MTTLATDKPRDYGLGDIAEFPVVTTEIIYEGAAVGEDTNGYARPLVAGDPFLGFAIEKVDNSSGSAGDKNVRVRTKGNIKLYISGLAITSNDQPSVYASDDDTFTLTASTNTRIGNVSQWIATGYAWVNFDTPRAPAASIATGDLGTDCVTGAKIADDAVSLEHLDSGIAPAYIIPYAGVVTTTGGGGASEAETVMGIVAASDKVVVALQANGTNNVTIVEAVITDNTITVTFSADPGNDAKWSYIVARAAA